MSFTVRRAVTALALAGLLFSTARPVSALPQRTTRPATRAGHGSFAGVWSWLNHLWAQTNAVLKPTASSFSPQGRGPTLDEGPFIDPNG